MEGRMEIEEDQADVEKEMEGSGDTNSTVVAMEVCTDDDVAMTAADNDCNGSAEKAGSGKKGGSAKKKSKKRNKPTGGPLMVH